MVAHHIQVVGSGLLGIRLCFVVEPLYAPLRLKRQTMQYTFTTPVGAAPAPRAMY